MSRELSRLLICLTSASDTLVLSAISRASMSLNSDMSEMPSRDLMPRRLKNSFFCDATVPSLTSDQDFRMYSVIAALIHHMA